MWPLLVMFLGCGEPAEGEADGSSVADGGAADGGAVTDDPCEGVDPAEPGCCHEAEDPISACATRLEGEVVLTGSFTLEESYDRSRQYGFTWDEDGVPQQTPVYLYFPPSLASVLPALEELGTVVLTNGGGCDGDGDGGIYGAFRLHQPEGELILAVGNSGAVSLDELTVEESAEAPAGEASCEPFPVDNSCFGAETNLWLRFTDGSDELHLLPGEDGDLGALQVYAVDAHSSSEPTGCTDVGGHTVRWLALPR